MKIEDLLGREVLDSRGNPTIEVEIWLDSGVRSIFSVPSGASTGSHEAYELRDSDPKRYRGKGVAKAVSNVNEVIKPRLLGQDPRQQKLIDRLLIELDGTPNKQKLGANAILAVSIVCAKAAAAALSLDLYSYLGGPNARLLPTPMMNIINGGEHADNNLDIQELMIMPVGANSVREAIRIGSEVFHQLKDLLKSKGYSTGVGDEGGFAPNVSSNEEAIGLIVEAIGGAGYEPGKDVFIALDVAATEFRTERGYTLAAEPDFRDRPAVDLMHYYEHLIEAYPIISIEDGFAEDDWEGWELATRSLGHRVQLVGDDLFVTNVERLKQGIQRKVANSIIIKPNQAGTLSETLWTIEVAKRGGYTCVVSNRSAETGEAVLASLAVACNAGQIKVGSLCRGERTANYNELMRIEERLGQAAVYDGFASLYSIQR
ncbi:MAG TPA: phosphopyruvate hydratase [Pyrinomonadaceae bacterium]|jgi:enolase|nr:phosphopyruvate hydratase [Pyrinomonadaceae bacterium]